MLRAAIRQALFLPVLSSVFLLTGIPLSEADPVRLTDSIGENRHPSWSPDGQFIYFESNRTGKYHVYRIPVAGGAIQQITFGSTDENFPEVSPDGAEVVYSTQENDPSLGLIGNIFKVPAGGGTPTQLSFSTHPRDVDWHGTWTPDGSTVIFTRRRGGDGADWDLLSVPAAGGAESVVLNLSNAQSYPGVSPDGLQIAFENNPGGVINVFQAPLSDPTNLTQLTFESVNTGQPKYSPGGTHLAYVSRRINGFLDLYLMNLTTLQSTRLTSDADSGTDPLTQDPAFSPDNSKIAFTSKREVGTYNVWILALDETESVSVDFDLMPNKCPNQLNRNAGGMMKAGIKGRGDFDVNSINPASILLEGTLSANRVSVRDIGNPSAGDCECPENGRDGIEDLSMSFDSRKVIELLDGSSTGELIVTGTLLDGTPFEGSDCLILREDHANLRGGPAIQFISSPVEPITRIQYRTESEGLVNLKVYDVSGRLVGSLVNEHKPAGQFVANWETSSRPNGIYFFRLQTPDGVHVGKTLVLK